MADQVPRMEIAQLVVEHHAAVYRYAYRLTGSVADAEDLTQQVFLVACQKLGQLRNEASARGWLLTVLRNAFLKGEQRWEPVPAVDVQLNLDGIPEAISAAEIDRERLQEALNEMPEGFRVVLAMFYFESYSYKEIAERLGMPIGTVMSRLARAKVYLRGRLFEPAGAGAPTGSPPAGERPQSRHE